MKISNKIILLFFLLASFCKVFPGLTPNILVFMDYGSYKKAKDLKVGDKIRIYDLGTHELREAGQEIQCIKTRKTKNLVLIKTLVCDLLVGETQKLYNRRIKKFIPAGEFKVGDELFSPAEGNLEVKDVSKVQLDEKITLYDISIKGGNVFSIKTKDKTHILVHNYAMFVQWATSEQGIRFLEEVAKFTGKLLVGGIFAKIASNGIFHHKKHKSRPKRSPNKDLEGVMKDTTLVDKPNGSSDVYEKDGGTRQREKDFEKVNVGDTREVKTDKGTLKIGTTKNGETVVSRDFSSDKSKNEETLEIQYGKNDYLKIRYP